MLFQKAQKKLNGNQNKIDRKNKERTRSLNRWYLSSPIGRILLTLSEKVSLCTSCVKIKKAGLSVETALVLPLFFLGMVTMISFMDIYSLQTTHLQALCEKTKEAGMYAYVADGNGPDEITLPDVYSYSPVGALIPLPKVWMHNTVKVHAWTGAEEGGKGSGDSTEPEEMVFVTESGSVYHTKAGCRYLNLSITQVSGSSLSQRRNDNGEKYSPCETCSRHQNPSGTVYITGSGNRYHNDASCSGLKRTVRLVKKSQLGNMHVCSKCG